MTKANLLKQIHPSKNDKVDYSKITSGSRQKLWWLCEKGHEWEAVVYSRFTGTGCPYCSGSRPIQGETDLATLKPLIASQWHFIKNGSLLPSMVLPNSSKKVWWICEKGHDFESFVYNRQKVNGCPYCLNQKVLTGFNDLKTVEPEIASEWHSTLNNGLSPSEVVSGTHKKVWWQCELGHEWESSISSRTHKDKRGCPYCAGNLPVQGISDLATSHPNLIKEWDYTKNITSPNMFSFGSSKKVWWICDLGHAWKTSIKHRTIAKSNCPTCKNKQVLSGFNDLQTRYPQVAAEWHPTKNIALLPSMVVFGSNEKVWWKCRLNHEWQAKVVARTGRSNDCPVCAGQVTLTGFNDIQTTHPLVAEEWHPTKNGKLFPTQVTAGSGRRIWWQCKLGHEWQAPVSDRTGQHGCRACINMSTISKAETEIFSYLTNLGLNVEQSNRSVIKPYELDIYLPDHKIAIEYNGVYWHSDKFLKNDSHYNKWAACRNEGVQLIQIWEDDWINHSSIILNNLINKITPVVNERVNTEIIQLKSDRAKVFFRNNHIHGHVKASEYLGLVSSADTTTIISAIALDKVDKSLQISRYAVSKNVNGALEQLLDYAIQIYAPHTLTATVDNMLAEHELYESLGFGVTEQIPPSSMELIRGKRVIIALPSSSQSESKPKLLTWDAGKSLLTKHVLW